MVRPLDTLFRWRLRSAAVVLAWAVFIFIIWWSELYMFVILTIALFTGIDLTLLWDPPVRWNTRHEMVIETPVGEVSSHAVRGNSVRKGLLTGNANSREWGEALVIEVTPGRYLFAVIEYYKPGEAMIFFPGEWQGNSARKLHTVKGQPREVPSEDYPLMVTFGDLKDPASVTEVDPFNLPATFGAGYRIKSYTVEITDEPVTDGRIEVLLPWLGPYPEPGLCPPVETGPIRFCRELEHGNFRLGNPP